MRVLRLLDPGAFAIDFHPYVTVVRGLEVDQRDQLLTALEHMPAGRTAGLSGLVEAHGVVLDITTDMLDLLGLASPDLDVVVRRNDLPGRGASAAARQLRVVERALEGVGGRIERAKSDLERLQGSTGEAQAGLDEVNERFEAARAVTAEADERRASIHERLDATRAAVEDDAAVASAAADAKVAAEDRLVEVEQATASIREERRRIDDEASRLAAELEAARGSLDPDAADGVAAAHARVAEVEAEVTAERDAASVAEEAEPVESAEERRIRLEHRRDELDVLLATLAGVDPAPVRRALEGVDADDGEPLLVPSTEATQLADQLTSIAEELTRLEAVAASDGDVVAAARIRLDEARSALVEAEQAVRMPHLEPDDVDELERAHAALLEAQDRSEGRFAGGRAERRLDETRETENEILERLGFNSYADYMMGTSILNVDAESEAQLDVSRAELADAEDAWAELQQGVDVELHRASLLDRRREARDRAHDLLGREVPIEELVDALRDHRVPAPEAGDAVDDLRLALQQVGLAVAHEQLDPDDLIVLAREWLAEEERASGRREEVGEERAEVVHLLAEVQMELGSIPSDLVDVDPEQRWQNRIDEARAALGASEERLRRHEQASVDVGRIEAAFAAAEQAEAQIAGEAARADEEVGEATAEVAAAAARVEEAQQALDAAREAVVQTEAELQALEDELDAAAGGALDDELARANEAFQRAATEQQEAESRLAELEAEREQHADEATGLRRAVAGEDDGRPDSEEIEWYLLARLAAQRQVSYAGSVPMVIDDALVEVADDDLPHLLDRLERMAAAVQLVVVSDNPAVAAWAAQAGDDRVAVVEPIAANDVVPFGSDPIGR